MPTLAEQRAERQAMAEEDARQQSTQPGGVPASTPRSDAMASARVGRLGRLRAQALRLRCFAVASRCRRWKAARQIHFRHDNGRGLIGPPANPQPGDALPMTRIDAASEQA